jgi:phosphinothricin acetyltransferase
MELSGKIVGYGSLSPYRTGRQAMRNIAEVSFFLDESTQGKGYGSDLLSYMITDCQRLSINTLIAILLDVNKRSVGLLKKYGFEKWGHFKDIIEFDDKSCGQLIYGLKLNKIQTNLNI